MIMLIAVLFAVAVHEMGHALAILSTRAGRIEGIVINLRGIGLKWDSYGDEPLKRTVVTLAGPLVNLVFAAYFYSMGFDTFGMANLVFGVVNLMPLPGSDGLRAFAHLRQAV